jgi:ABC-type glycerol-3-phosphate transport system permease component
MTKTRAVRRVRGTQIALIVGVIVILVANAFPFYWMAITSFRPRDELFQSPPKLYPGGFDPAGYIRLLTETNFFSGLANSLIVAIGTTLLSLVVATLGAYGATRFKFPGSEAFGTLILYAYSFAPILIVVPLYGMFRDLGLINTHIGLIIAYSSFGVPFALWLLKPFFESIPAEIEEAAFMDGANRWRSATQVLIPMATPSLIAVSVFTFLLAWEDYLFAKVLITRPEMKTLPVVLHDLFSASIMDWPLLMACAVLINIPVLIGFLFAQRYLIAGWGAGAVK